MLLSFLSQLSLLSYYQSTFRFLSFKTWNSHKAKYLEFLQFLHKTYFNEFLIHYLRTPFIIHQATWDLLNMNCKTSASSISILLFQASHSSQWLQSIVTSKIFPISSATAAMQPLVEEHHRLPHTPSNEVTTFIMSSWFLRSCNSFWEAFFVMFFISSWLSYSNLSL